MALALRASMSAPARAAHSRVHATRTASALGPRRAMTVVRQAHAGRGYESDADFDPYVHDQLTHSVTGEYDMGIFFLMAGTFFMMPVLFPGVVIFIQSAFESMGWNNGIPM